MEERFLFLLLLLREPRLRHGLRDLDAGRARRSSSTTWRCCPASSRATRAPGCRWSAVHDASPRPLSEKLLERPRLLRQIADLVPDRTAVAPRARTTRRRSSATWRSRWASRCTAPTRGCSTSGTKTGCRRLFAEEGVPHPIGVEDLHTLDDAARRDRCGCARSGRSVRDGDRQAQRGRLGRGQRRWSTCPACPPPGDADERAAVARAAAGDAVRVAGHAASTRYVAKLAERGGIVEERIVGRDLRSPSVQLRVTAARRGRAAVDPRPAARRAERPELPRLPLPGRRRLRADDQRARR